MNANTDANGAPAAAAPPAVWNRSGYFHEGLFFETEQQLLERCVPFAQDSIRLGDPLIVVATEPVIDTLSEAIPDLHDRCWAVHPSERWWQGNAYATMAAYMQLMRPLIQTGAPWRLIGQPCWLDEPGGDMWARLEAVSNVNFAGHPYHSLCLHDTRALSARGASFARQTHPCISAGASTEHSPAFVEPAEFIERHQAPWPDPPPATAVLEVTSASAARAFALTQIVPAAIEDVDALQIVVSELVANSLEHAHTGATLRLWAHAGEIIVEVNDTGPGFDGRFAGYTPPDPGGLRSRGLWLVRYLASDFAVRSTARGCSARARLPATRP